MRVPPAAIPSPDHGTIDIGPVPVHAYGVLLALGVVLAAWIAERRWARWGGDRRELGEIWVVVVVSGVIGARLYHVVTDYERFRGHWLRAPQIWEGGLGIWGAVIGGALAVVVMCRVKGLPTLVVTDAIAPGLLAAQALGRWGNWFNQELFGRPTSLPWALEIDPQHRPVRYAAATTFHPTFLYESLYCLAALGVLLLLERRLRLVRGQVFALYVVVYTLGRFFFENLRVDPAHEVAGMRVNAWVSVACFVLGVAWFVWLGRHETAGDDLAGAAEGATRAP